MQITWQAWVLGIKVLTGMLGRAARQTQMAVVCTIQFFCLLPHCAAFEDTRTVYMLYARLPPVSVGSLAPTFTLIPFPPFNLTPNGRRGAIHNSVAERLRDCELRESVSDSVAECLRDCECERCKDCEELLHHCECAL